MSTPSDFLDTGTPAWLRDPSVAATAPTPRSCEEPELRLRVIHEDGEALTVEVVDGVTETRGALLYVKERGLFAIVASLSRNERGARVYLRLRAFCSALEWA